MTTVSRMKINQFLSHKHRNKTIHWQRFPPDHHREGYTSPPIHFFLFPELWVWLMRTSLAQAATLPSQCPAHTQHLLIIRNNIWQAARLQTPPALLTCSPTMEADYMLSRWDRKGVIRKWFIFLFLNEDSHWGLPITQSMAGVLLPASSSLLFFLFFNNMCKKVGCTLFLPFVASSGPGGKSNQRNISESLLVQMDEPYVVETEGRNIQMKSMPRERPVLWGDMWPGTHHSKTGAKVI